MRAMVRELLGNAIDYAGIYPPARLSLDDSQKRYFRYKEGKESWILGRFVCPASRLGELSDLLRRDLPRKLPLTVIGTAASDSAAFRATLDRDAEAMSELQDRFGEGCLTEAYEIRLPPTGGLEEQLNALSAFNGIDLFAEFPLGESTKETLAAIAGCGGIGAKARTGGTEAAAFPSSRDLAAFLKESIDLDLEFKLTAGLHEPVRHYDPALRATHHGFLNVFFAASLHQANTLATVELESILDEESPAAFNLSDAEISWNGLRATVDDIREARALFSGFGSCSVDEPLQGLARLNLVEGVAA